MSDNIGTTVSEIADEVELEYEYVAELVDELVVTGMAVDTGLRRPGRGGHLETVWALTGEGKLAVSFEQQ